MAESLEHMNISIEHIFQHLFKRWIDVPFFLVFPAFIVAVEVVVVEVAVAVAVQAA